METGVYWRFELPEEVEKRTVNEGRVVDFFDFHQLARGNGYGDDGVRCDRYKGRQTAHQEDKQFW